MVNARAAVALDDDEVKTLLRDERVIILATIGPDQLPHLAPMWYLPLDDGRIAMWTYGRSQKVRNLRREPRATLLVEAGESYHELRGVSLDCVVEFVEDTQQVEQLGARLSRRYADTAPAGAGPVDGDAEIPDVVRAQARKRVGVIFTPRRVRSWDHGKMAAPA
jgi:PPOX class probable F420-dependent enzyme